MGCKAAGVCLQYFFTVYFLCLALEAKRSHSIITGLVSRVTFLDKCVYLAIGWGLPIIPAVASAALAFHENKSDYS